MAVFTKHTTGLSNRLPLEMTPRRERLLHAMAHGLLNSSMWSEPQFGLSLKDWRALLALLEVIERITSPGDKTSK